VPSAPTNRPDAHPRLRGFRPPAGPVALSNLVLGMARPAADDPFRRQDLSYYLASDRANRATMSPKWASRQSR
jgi:hypothetical protein